MHHDNVVPNTFPGWLRKTHAWICFRFWKWWPFSSPEPQPLPDNCLVFAFCVASGRLRTDGMEEENVTSSLQTKWAIYLAKTPFQLHDILMPLHVESDSCDRFGVGVHEEYFHAKNRLEKLCVFMFCREGKIFLILFGDHLFHLATMKIFQSPVGACLIKVILDPIRSGNARTYSERVLENS